MKGFAVFAGAKPDGAAVDRTANLRIRRALVAIFVMRLSRILLAFSEDVRNTVRETAHLREQQNKNQQQPGEQGTMHAAHFNQQHMQRQ